MAEYKIIFLGEYIMENFNCKLIQDDTAFDDVYSIRIYNSKTKKWLDKEYNASETLDHYDSIIDKLNEENIELKKENIILKNNVENYKAANHLFD